MYGYINKQINISKKRNTYNNNDALSTDNLLCFFFSLILLAFLTI